MKINIYPSATKRDKYLAVPHGTDFKTWKAPEGFDPDLLELRRLQSSIDLNRGDERTAINPNDVLDQIAEKGWAVIHAGINITVKTAGR